MESSRRLEIERLFAYLIELPRAERDRALDEACGHDEELRKDVQELLSALHDAPPDALPDYQNGVNALANTN